MTKRAAESVTCPQCGHQQEAEIYSSINVTLNPEAKERILNQEFFRMTCQECGAVHQLAYACLYHDMERKLMIYLIPGDREEMKEKLDEIQHHAADAVSELEAGYKLRMVSDVNELMEKIRIFDRGLSDKTVELVKLFYYAQLREQNPEFQPEAIYFDGGNAGNADGRSEADEDAGAGADGSGFGLIFSLPGGKAGTVEVPPDFYQNVEKQFEERLADQPGAGYQTIDLAYAAALIS